MSTARPKRYAAGRARALGLPTRGTTNPNRLRRVDRWIAGTLTQKIAAAADPLVVDLGFGASPVTTLELAQRLSGIRPDIDVVGIEIDRERVAAAQSFATEQVTFRHGGFELPLDGRRPVLVRAMNVLRQYDAGAVTGAWATMAASLAPDGLLVEGTCDELGRRCTWVTVDTTATARTLTLAADLRTLDRPSDLAERLPKALIHRNAAGERIHALLADLDRAWDTAAALVAFGNRQRWIAAAAVLRETHEVLDDRRRWRLGELTVSWADVAPMEDWAP